MDAEAVNAGLPPGGFVAGIMADSGDDSSRTFTAARQASQRLAHLARRVAAPRTPPVPPNLRGVIEAHRAHHPKADVALVVRAYETAFRLHDGQMRRSGDPY
nr:GTP pyrophosphokinase [Micromonospora sp. DSM 115978]